MGSSDNSIQKTDKANIELSDQCDNNKDKCDFDRTGLIETATVGGLLYILEKIYQVSK